MSQSPLFLRSWKDRSAREACAWKNIKRIHPKRKGKLTWYTQPHQFTGSGQGNPQLETSTPLKEGHTGNMRWTLLRQRVISLKSAYKKSPHAKRKGICHKLEVSSQRGRTLLPLRYELKEFLFGPASCTGREQDSRRDLPLFNPWPESWPANSKKLSTFFCRQITNSRLLRRIFHFALPIHAAYF